MDGTADSAMTWRVSRTAGAGGRGGRVRGSAAGRPRRRRCPRTELAELERAKLAALRVRALLERRRRREAELSGAVRHRRRPGRPARPRRRAAGDRAPGPRAARRRRRLHDPQRRGARRHLHAGHRRLGVGPVPAAAAAARRRAGRPGRADRHPVRHRRLPADDRFRHTGEIDAGVGEEGLVAILGVPLRLGAPVARRAATPPTGPRGPFAREEVALLGSLAAHAAVAIDNARLLDETRAALAELSAANATIRAHSSSVERAAEAHDRMTELVLRGGGVEDVAAAVTEVLGGALLVLDADGRSLARVGAIDEPDRARWPRRSRRRRAERAHGPPRRQLVRRGRSPAPRTSCTLVLRPTGELVDADQRILERAALVTALLLLFRRSVAEAEGRVRGELLDDLRLPAGPRPGGAARAGPPARRRPGRAARAGRGRRRRGRPAAGAVLGHVLRAVPGWPGGRPRRPRRC